MKLAQVIPLSGHLYSKKSHAKFYPDMRGAGPVTDNGDDHYFENLIEKIKSEQCEESFKKIFDYYYGRILSYFKRGGIEDQRALELVQEVFVTLWNKSYLFNSLRGSFNVWIFTIARNIKFDQLRAGQRDLLQISAEDIYDQSEEPSLQNETLNLTHGMRSLIEMLPLDQKEVVYAMYYEGYTHSEYAELKNIPLGTVKSRVRLALVQLKKGMEE